ncbi:MAG: DUF3263 domain-containing protein [Acidimicrobiia bacterium]
MLSREEKAILDFERVWGNNGPKDRAIEGVLGLASTRYYELLGDLVSRRAAMDYDPLTVRRVLRVVEAAPKAAVS